MVKKASLSILITLILFAIYYYVAFPALSLISPGFYVLLIVMFTVIFLVYLTLSLTMDKVVTMNQEKLDIFSKICIGCAGVALAVLIVGGLMSSKLFASSKYAKVLDVQSSKFEDELPETERVDDIALMDSESAAIIGNRAMGSLTDIVSQFEVSSDYTQIDYNGKPMKVSPLEYAGFFKWFNNKSDGIPGYILVDPIDNTAKYIKTDESIKYSPSAYFNKNVYRHLQFKYPAKLFGDCFFEIDNEGNPYWICPEMTHEAGLFGAQTVKGCVVMNASTGECVYYKVGDVPEWVDIVYDGTLIEMQYDWYGTLSGGFWNSVIGNKGCKVTTDDFGYKVMNGDVWIYTGVTSVNGDKSNIGFILANSRTGECKYFDVSGAEEHSAMSAAEGEVQNLGYIASFPSLINICNHPTYIMVLKDDGGLVKQYALVNVEKYNVVATATTQKEVLKEYKKLLKDHNMLSAEDVKAEQLFDTIMVEDVEKVVVDGNTIVYIKSQTGDYYKQEFGQNENLIKVKPGTMMKIYYDEKSDDVTTITSISFEVNESESGDLPDVDSMENVTKADSSDEGSDSIDEDSALPDEE